VIVMAKASKTKKEADKEEKNDKAPVTKKEQKRPKPKSKVESSKTAADDEAKSTEPLMKKKQASAMEIDTAQSKRLVKVTKRAKKIRKVVKAVKLEVKPRDIGVEVIPPEEACTDPFCPFHGTLSVRGQIINGVVMSSKMNKTAIIQREIKRYIPKYERFEKRTHRYAVHNPPCLNVQRGDLVKIMECRPLSKSKSFVVIEKM
jgi:small subunit ribosomal protein S17